MRIVDNQLSFTRPPEMAADRAAALRQTGLTANTLFEIRQDAEEERQAVRDRPDVEGALVRTDAESESAANQEQPKQEDVPPTGEDEELRRRASEKLLNLPVSRGKNTEMETSRFDIKV